MLPLKKTQMIKNKLLSNRRSSSQNFSKRMPSSLSRSRNCKPLISKSSMKEIIISRNWRNQKKTLSIRSTLLQINLSRWLLLSKQILLSIPLKMLKEMWAIKRFKLLKITNPWLHLIRMNTRRNLRKLSTKISLSIRWLSEETLWIESWKSKNNNSSSNSQIARKKVRIRPITPQLLTIISSNNHRIMLLIVGVAVDRDAALRLSCRKME